MKLELLTAAALSVALTLTAAPAGAQRAIAIGIPNAPSSDMVGPSRSARQLDFCRDNDRRGDRHHRGRDRVTCVADGWAYADGEWALYNNRTWEPDSYNDWWHDRPDRAFPRWVQEQRTRGSCEPSRMWWSGSGWHC